MQLLYRMLRLNKHCFFSSRRLQPTEKSSKAQDDPPDWCTIRGNGRGYSPMSQQIASKILQQVNLRRQQRITLRLQPRERLLQRYNFNTHPITMRL